MENNKEIENSSTGIISNLKIWIKKNRSSKNPFIKIIIEAIYFIVIGLYNIKRVCTDKEYRALIYLKAFKSRRVQQTTPLTAMNRYPVIFSACSEYFRKNKDIKILSYGCSTGEEVLTLRRYFPNATIVGAEINKHSLEVCKSHNVDDKITFINSTPRNIKNMIHLI